ncbi:unnamed protein product, partial [Notodromas monacha]
LPVRTLHPKALEKLLQDEETLQKTENRCHSDCLLEEDSPRTALSLQEGEKVSEQASESICQTEKVSKSKRRKSVNDERNKGGETIAISFPDRGKLIKDENLGKIPGNLSPMGSLSSNRLSSDSELAWQLATFHQKSSVLSNVDDSSNPENTSSQSSSRKTTVIRTTFARSILRKKTKEVPSLESQESLKYVRMLDADSGANLPALRTSDSFSVDGKISLSKIEATTGSTNRSRSGRWIDPKRITVTRQEASPADIDSDTFSPNDEEEEPRPKTVGFEYWF